ncbi:MAG: DUF362 domain-containing protein [Verrucomicrobiales bacterium]|nr:DUF362 domain-containing protein [Verrucomicrobiales bacterium]
MKVPSCNRRHFLRSTASVALGAPFAITAVADRLFGAEKTSPAPAARSDTKVAIASCRSYGPEVRTALDNCFDLIGGIGSLVKSKTVTVKINLTGTDFTQYLNRPVGETFMTHESTVLALTSALFKAGAKRVRLVESTQSRAALENTLSLADWDVNALRALGDVQFENTRNLGSGKSYSRLKVPAGGYMFSSLDVNHSYADTDVMVSLCKMKNHITAGVTLSMKNLFGITPNALYGDKAGSEDATAGRGPLHNPTGFEHVKLPGLKEGVTSKDPTYRVPHIIVDECAARPIHLAIIDGITSMSGGEGPWCRHAAPLKFVAPGVLIVGFNPVSTDAVGTAVMGYADPRAPRGTKPFHFCDNHLRLAEQAGLGVADLSRIEVRGLSIERARHSFG